MLLKLWFMESKLKIKGRSYGLRDGRDVVVKTHILPIYLSSLTHSACFKQMGFLTGFETYICQALK